MDGRGVYASGGAEITVDGIITADLYIKTDGNEFIEGEWIEPTTKEGYYTYTDGNNTVWVKIPDVYTTPTDANSGITDQTQGPCSSKQVTLTVTVQNAAGSGLPGYTAGDFTVTVNGIRTNFAGTQFFNFTDNGDSTYTVVFTGDFNSAIYPFTYLTVRGVIIEYGPTPVTLPQPDITPPVWTSGYPRIGYVSDEDAGLTVSADEACVVYYVVLTDGAKAPSSVQVRNRQDGEGKDIPYPGSNHFEYTNPPDLRGHGVIGLTPETGYNIYVVLVDKADNLQDTPARVDVTTLPDIDTIPDDANSGIMNQVQGPASSRQVKLTVTVRNAAGDPITGIGPGFFTVSVDGSDAQRFDTSGLFSGFSDNRDGTYTVVFTGDAENTEYSFTNLTVRYSVGLDLESVVIEAGPIVVTTPPAGANTTPPTVETYSPTNGAINVAIDTNLILTFNEDVKSAAGHVYLNQTADDLTVQTFAVNDPTVTVSGDTVTINLDNLEYSTGYYVMIDINAFEDAAGNPYAGISGSDTWNFTTVAEDGASSDTEAPTVPTGLIVIERTASSISIKWNASADASGIAGYDIQMKRGSEGAYSIVGTTTGSATAFTKTGLDASTAYYFRVRARDGSSGANVSNWSAEISATTRNNVGSNGSSIIPAPPTYKADVSGIGTSKTTLPVNVNANTGIATTDMAALAEDVFDGAGTVVITVPTIPEINSNTLEMPAATLSGSQEEGVLTFSTGYGSLTIPADMLAGVSGTEGKKAGITIGQEDKSGLPAELQTSIGDRPIVQLTLALDGKQTDWNNPDAPVTVSIPYTPTAAELANPESIVVWYIDGSGRSVCVPNGRYDPATVTFTVTHFSYYAVSYKHVSFKDVAKDTWYAKAVSFIAARDITTGTGGGNFSPETKLTRGQFIVMLMKAYSIAPDASPSDNFSDAGNTYYTSYLAAAKRLGITTGVGNNMYAPGKEITRQEMLTLLYNVYVLRSLEQLPQGNSGKTLSDFSDAGQITSWAKDAMALLVKTGTISGLNGRLDPVGGSTRAQMAQVQYSLLGK